jgi:hypothetical protein
MTGYERLWRMYPQHRRGALQDAKAAVAEALAKGATIEGIAQALKADLESESWTKEGGKYVPGFAKWLGREPWPAHTEEGDDGAWRF